MDTIRVCWELKLSDGMRPEKEAEGNVLKTCKGNMWPKELKEWVKLVTLSKGASHLLPSSSH